MCPSMTTGNGQAPRIITARMARRVSLRRNSRGTDAARYALANGDAGARLRHDPGSDRGHDAGRRPQMVRTVPVWSDTRLRRWRIQT